MTLSLLSVLDAWSRKLLVLKHWAWMVLGDLEEFADDRWPSCNQEAREREVWVRQHAIGLPQCPTVHGANQNISKKFLNTPSGTVTFAHLLMTAWYRTTVVGSLSCMFHVSRENLVVVKFQFWFFFPPHSYICCWSAKFYSWQGGFMAAERKSQSRKYSHMVRTSGCRLCDEDNDPENRASGQFILNMLLKCPRFRACWDLCRLWFQHVFWDGVMRMA